MPPLEITLRLHGETLLYALFFGGILVFALLETRIAMRAHGANRTRRWPVNWVLTLLNILLLGALPVSALLIADAARDAGFGLMNGIDLPLWAQIVVGIAAFSLQSWAVHYAMHYVPILWRFHRVHHTDTHLDVSTTVRFHPIELLLSLPIAAVVILSLGIAPVAVIVYELMDAVINLFSHANIRLPARLDAVLSRLIVTPHLHRVHHSTQMDETNSNFGATLPLWDMLFGTYRRKDPRALARQPIGLTEMQDHRASSLWWALSLPFRAIERPETDPADANRPARRSGL